MMPRNPKVTSIIHLITILPPLHYVDLMTIIGWIYLVFTELSRNRDIPLSSQEKLKLNLNGAVELIKEDKQSENGKSMKKTERDEWS